MDYNVPWANEEWFIKSKKRQRKILEKHTKDEIEKKCKALFAEIEALQSVHSDWTGALTEIYCEEYNGKKKEKSIKEKKEV